MRRILILFSGLLLAHTLLAQRSVELRSRWKVIAEVPVQLGVGYEWHYSKRFSTSLQAGVLTPPNSTLILNALQALGTSQEVVLMLQSAFKFGTVYKGTLCYNFRKNYAGGFVQVLNLTGKDTPTTLVEDALGVSISSYPRLAGKSAATPTSLSLKSTLVQMGVMYGRRIGIGKRSELDLEFAISANLGSSSSLSSDTRNVEALSTYLDSYLADIYKSYAFVPSVTIAYAIRLGK